MGTPMCTLTEEQKDIIRFVAEAKGNLVVQADPGTGKTFTAKEVLKTLPSTAKVLFAAFGNKIAKEAADGVKKLGRLDCKVEVKTLHSLGSRLIRYYGPGWKDVELDDYREEKIVEKLYVGDKFKELREAAVTLAKRSKGSHPFATDRDLYDLVWDLFLYGDDLEDKGFQPEDVVKAAKQILDLSKVYDGTISFPDMVWLPLVMKWIRPWFNTVIIDECQDLNQAQILLAQKVCRRDGRIFVFGDERQAIFGWRGADSKSMSRLVKELNAKKLTLSITFRCPKKVVELARQFAPNYRAHESNIEGIVDSTPVQNIYDMAKPGDIIISRKNAPLSTLCLGFLKRGIRAYIEGRSIAEGLKSTAKAIAGKKNSIPAFLQKLQKWEARQVARIEKADCRGKEQKVQQIQDKAECLFVIAEGLNSISELLERIESLFSDDGKDGSQGKVMLSSIHRAKGLEFPHVFGLEETLKRGDTCQEEKNLEHVLITRTMEHLTWVTGIN